MNNIFNSTKNVKLLWEILLDQENVKYMNDLEKLNILEVFNQHKNTFINQHKNQPPLTTPKLMELNKQFLSTFIQFIDHNYKKELRQDIQEERQNKFEKELSEKKMDFEKLITPSKPVELDFSEKIEDTKIKSMDSLIAQTIAQRNYEISQIQNQTSNGTNESWLKSKETSIKSDINSNINSNSNSNEKLKFIKIKEIIPIQHDIINLKVENNKKENDKKISWNDNNEIKYFNKNDILLENDNNINIFDKLKKVNNTDTNIEIIKRLDVINNNYINILEKLEFIISKI
jgi:hypothetical protein